jgi:uncharacterized protein (DUF4415 family)
MKKTEKDYKYLETSAEAQAAGLKRITRPKFLDKIPKNAPLRDCKSRITIYLDADIIEHFKQEAAGSGEGYQTLINRALRSVVESENALPEQIKENLLSDKEFLQSLKNALAI